MKINCGPTEEEQRHAAFKASLQWHSRFCWWPLRIGPRECRWLEFVEQRQAYLFAESGSQYKGPLVWEYRALGK